MGLQAEEKEERRDRLRVERLEAFSMMALGGGLG